MGDVTRRDAIRLAAAAGVVAAAPRDVAAAEGRMHAVHFFDRQTLSWQNVYPLTGGNDKGTEIGRLPLIVKGVGAVQFGGKVYPTAKEGLYRFLLLYSKPINLISLARESPAAGERGFQGLSLVPLAGALANLQVHGDPTGLELPRQRDELGKRVEGWSGQLRTRAFLPLTCGEAARMVRDVLAAEGYRVGWVDADPGAPPDSHVMVNVYWPARKRWVLVDPDLGLMFQDARGEFLHAHEVRDLLSRDDPIVFPLKKFAVDPRWGDGDSSWAAWYEVQFKDHVSMLTWYRVVFRGLKAFDYRTPIK